jgi:hypothetical protein
MPDQIPDEQTFPLEMYLCSVCGLSQLRHVVSREDIFDDYPYLASSSGALRRHYKNMVDGALAEFKPVANALIVDIGCNDGIILARYPKNLYRLLGTEPSRAGEAARKEGIDVLPEFFGAGLANRIVAAHGRAQVVTSAHYFIHTDDVISYANGVRTLLADDGVFIVDFPYLLDMVKGCYFDTVYHEHLCYFALTPIVALCAQAGLKAFRVADAGFGASGPAMRLFVARAESPHPVEDSIAATLAAEAEWGLKRPETYQVFAGRVAEVREKILSFIDGLAAERHTIGAFGAPAKGNTLLNYLGLGPDRIVSAAENNLWKIGKLTPGSHIPIVDDNMFLRLGISHALLLSWNYADFFLANSEFAKRGGKFIIPLPEPMVRP